MSYLIHHFLERSADRFPEKEALVHGKARFTYREIESQANKIARYFEDQGFKKGERVALLVRNSIDYVSAYYGILKAGCVVVPLNTGMDGGDLSRISANCNAKAVVYETVFNDVVVRGILPENVQINFLITTDGENPRPQSFQGVVQTLHKIYSMYPSARLENTIIDKDISSIIYTSGSTGAPKGVPLTHLNIVTNTRSINSYLELNSMDRCIVLLPFYYVYGKTLLNLHFMVSGTVVLDNRFTFPNVVLKTMIEEKVTGLSGVPSTFSILLNKSSVAKMNFPHLRYLTQAGGHMPDAVKEVLLQIFSEKQIFVMYGATEASARLSYLPPERLREKLRSIGKPIPNVEMEVCLENGQFGGPEEEGEIVARGSNIMKGYWNDLEETARVLKNGWYHTGDIGRKDAEGYFYVTGRKKEMIKTGVYKVSAKEIEEVLYTHPSVQEAAVIGVSDEVLGEAVKAFVVLSSAEKVKSGEIQRHCEQNLAPYKVPKQIEQVDSLPKNESGKILKQKLR
ncbi:MAG: class I adenylate-forming enzyme family protein [Nitrospinota bacterium]